MLTNPTETLRNNIMYFFYKNKERIPINLIHENFMSCFDPDLRFNAKFADWLRQENEVHVDERVNENTKKDYESIAKFLACGKSDCDIDRVMKNLFVKWRFMNTDLLPAIFK